LHFFGIFEFLVRFLTVILNWFNTTCDYGCQ